MKKKVMMFLIGIADGVLYYTGCFHTRPKLEVWAYDHGYFTTDCYNIGSDPEYIEFARKTYCNGRHYASR